MAKEINVLALVKGKEQYVFFFDDSNRTEMLRTLGRYAANPALSFTWYDAAVLSEKIRRALPAGSAKASQLAKFSKPSTSPCFTIPAPGEKS